MLRGLKCRIYGSLLYILVTVSQIHNVVSSSRVSSRGGRRFCLTRDLKKARVRWKALFSPVQNKTLFSVSVPLPAAADLQSTGAGWVGSEKHIAIKRKNGCFIQGLAENTSQSTHYYLYDLDALQQPSSLVFTLIKADRTTGSWAFVTPNLCA